MSKAKNYNIINIFSKFSGRNYIIAYRIKPILLSSCYVSFYIVRKNENKYTYYKIAQKRYDDCCIDAIEEILKEKGFIKISSIEKRESAKRKRLLYK